MLSEELYSLHLAFLRSYNVDGLFGYRVKTVWDGVV